MGLAQSSQLLCLSVAVLYLPRPPPRVLGLGGGLLLPSEGRPVGRPQAVAERSALPARNAGRPSLSRLWSQRHGGHRERVHSHGSNGCQSLGHGGPLTSVMRVAMDWPAEPLCAAGSLDDTSRPLADVPSNHMTLRMCSTRLVSVHLPVRPSHSYASFKEGKRHTVMQFSVSLTLGIIVGLKPV